MAQRAYLEIARQLVVRLRTDGAIPGTRLPPERVLAEQLDVSRPTIREALVALELRGIVETHVGAGTFVTNLDAPGDEHVTAKVAADASPSDILRARMAIEPAVARLAAANWSRGNLSAIARPVHQVERMAADGSTAHPGKEDRRFHAAVAAASGNPVLTYLCKPIWALMAQRMWEEMKQQQWRTELTKQMAVEHRAIYDAIRNRDNDLAGFEAERHLRNVTAVLFGLDSAAD